MVPPQHHDPPLPRGALRWGGEGDAALWPHPLELTGSTAGLCLYGPIDPGGVATPPAAHWSLAWPHLPGPIERMVRPFPSMGWVDWWGDIGGPHGLVGDGGAVGPSCSLLGSVTAGLPCGGPSLGALRPCRALGLDLPVSKGHWGPQRGRWGRWPCNGSGDVGQPPHLSACLVCPCRSVLSLTVSNLWVPCSLPSQIYLFRKCHWVLVQISSWGKETEGGKHMPYLVLSRIIRHWRIHLGSHPEVNGCLNPTEMSAPMRTLILQVRGEGT